ncbi:hypothetical protein BHU72_05285 [Desulfuribacillus stibiiarsenatis]|uniref:Methyltransferase type 11 domain-containing protein n=1 Tax=Desulfuribacillus stibiiarsenatis TaxID=1390249 RepID=A0A1E5L5U4_9FIRM|nr:hypothetical protein [Desulfuribacillus stibiiarsenatis]OEH85500.1 hypothetical protein BHU72_05285 [Desulfuribacillus stibiiarsenatis]
MTIKKKIAKWSIQTAIKEQNLQGYYDKIKEIVPDLSNQYTRENVDYDSFIELKIRAQHSFQCKMMFDAIKLITRTTKQNSGTVVDIGDSSGNHMIYLRNLLKDEYKIQTLSVNLDPIAVEKIKNKGLPALLVRAEELTLDNTDIIMYTSFEMLEHLHNPALFLRRLAVKGEGEYILITVPYVKHSRIGLHSLRNKNRDNSTYAETEHIFELSPNDWNLLFLHSGWEVVFKEIYLQYPKKLLIKNIMSNIWKQKDFEGFYGVLLKKNLSESNKYMDWEEL